MSSENGAVYGMSVDEEPEVPGENLHGFHFIKKKDPTKTNLGSKPDRCGWKLVTRRLSPGVATRK